MLASRAASANDGLTAVTGIRRRKRPANVLTPELEQRILDTILKTLPTDGSTHWSVRMSIGPRVAPAGQCAWRMNRNRVKINWQFDRKAARRNVSYRKSHFTQKRNLA